MKVIWNSLWYDSVNDWVVNSSLLFKHTLQKIWISCIWKDSRLNNEQFNKVLNNFSYHLECLKLYLYQRWYNLEKIFKSEKSFMRYVKENRIKMKIKNWKILIWNVYWEVEFLDCVWIVLATKIPTVNEEVNKILEK